MVAHHVSEHHTKLCHPLSFANYVLIYLIGEDMHVDTLTLG